MFYPCLKVLPNPLSQSNNRLDFSVSPIIRISSFNNLPSVLVQWEDIIVLTHYFISLIITLCEIRPLRTLYFGKRAIKVLQMCTIYHLYNTFPRHLQSCSSEVALPNVHQEAMFTRKGLVKMTIPSPFQHLNDSLSKTLKFLKGLFSCTVIHMTAYCFWPVVSLSNRLSCTRRWWCCRRRRPSNSLSSQTWRATSRRKNTLHPPTHIMMTSPLPPRLVWRQQHRK